MTSADLRNTYRKLFAIEEIENSRLLQVLTYVLSFSFFVTFYNWIERDFVSTTAYLAGTHVCPPYFPSCGDWYFLTALPYGYSQSAFYVFLFMVLGFGVFSAYRRDWVTAHAVLLVCLAWKSVWAFLLTYGVTGNFDYYDMTLAFVVIFLREKEYFAKVTFVSLYVLASSIKIDSGWIFANYFNSLFTGAPIFGSHVVPLFTNFLIVMQMLGSWLLLSNNKTLQRTAFVYFLLFHVYSGVIVNFRYISISIPALFVLFSQPELFSVRALKKTTVAGYAFILVLLCGQLIGILIPGDQKITLEGNYYGLYMFEANHQCISTAKVFYKDGTAPTVISRENHVANVRCDPYRYWFPLKTRCDRNANIERISWTFDHSINGEHYKRIVDVDNLCTLTYQPFAHNEWLKIADAQTLDIPVYKTGYAYVLPPQIQIPAEMVSNDALLGNLSALYWTLWLASLLFAACAVAYATVHKK